MRKISANPDKLLTRASKSTIRVGFQLEALTRVLTTFEALIEQGDPRLAPREVPEDLNPSGRLLWLIELAANLEGLGEHAGRLRERLELSATTPETLKVTAK